MRLFRTKAETQMDVLIEKIESNMANNYKDAAQEAFREFEQLYAEAAAEGRLKESRLSLYSAQLDSFRSRLKNFTHKDQKPYWT